MLFLQDIDSAEFALTNISNRVANVFGRDLFKRTAKMPKLTPLPVAPRRRSGLIMGKRVRTKQGGTAYKQGLSPRIAQPVSYRNLSGYEQGLTNVRSRSKYGLN